MTAITEKHKTKAEMTEHKNYRHLERHQKWEASTANFPSQWLLLEPQGPFLAFTHEYSSRSKERLLTTGSDLGKLSQAHSWTHPLHHA